MINVVAWSKDRATQLDLMLSSYKKYFADWKTQKLSIIYTFSTAEYGAGYELVKKYHPEFNWIKETNFRTDTLNCINDPSNPYISFLVDDDVFIDYFSINDPEFKLLETNPKVACVSCRLAPYVNFCYPQNKPQCQPAFIEKNVWRWVGSEFDWGYPISVASFHVFRRSDLAFLNFMPFRGANTLEGGMEGTFTRSKDLMVCYDHAKCICTTNNKVQMENMNRNENSHPLQVLNAEFLKGRRLDHDINDKMTLNMCHGPVKLEWRKV
jgi:hypothetical protein